MIKEHLQRPHQSPPLKSRPRKSVLVSSARQVVLRRGVSWVLTRRNQATGNPSTGKTLTPRGEENGLLERYDQSPPDIREHGTPKTKRRSPLYLTENVKNTSDVGKPDTARQWVFPISSSVLSSSHLLGRSRIADTILIIQNRCPDVLLLR